MNCGSLKNNLNLKDTRMKKNILFIAIILAAMLIGYSSCKRDFSLTSPVKTTEGTSYLAIIDASPNFRRIYNLPDSFNVFINGQKITGFTPGTVSPFMTFGATFPSTTTGFGYVAVPPGLQQIKFSVSGKINPDSIAIATFNKTFLPDQQYTFMITDSIQSTRDSSQIFLQDVYNFPPTIGYYNLRFIHAVLNDTLGKTVDLFSYAKNAVIYSNLKPGAVTAFSQIGVNLQVTDTLYVTRSLATGVSSTTPLSSRLILAKMSFQAGSQKSYTVYFRGDINLTATTNIKSRALSFYRHE